MTKYTLSGDHIIRQQTGSDAVIDYLYDASGSVIRMKITARNYYNPLCFPPEAQGVLRPQK
ncbi:MAG: hypothetical protein QM689_02740 [Oscillospiraceae bacterium]